MSDLLSMAVCSRCQSTSAPDPATSSVTPVSEKPGAVLLAQLQPLAAAHGLSLQPTNCLAGCERPLTVAVSSPGRASYLFGNIDPETDLPALIAFADLYRSQPGGWTNEGQRPLGLRGKIIARIPAPSTAVPAGSRA